jgi:hypothetical protein
MLSGLNFKAMRKPQQGTEFKRPLRRGRENVFCCVSGSRCCMATKITHEATGTFESLANQIQTAG